MTRARVAGVDEAGRGPLAGPVVASAVILDPRRPILGLADSKVLSVNRREVLAGQIRERSLAWSVASASVEEIDRINILQATLLAMRRAIEALDAWPDGVLVDGNRLPDLSFGDRAVSGRAVVGGDSKHAAISAASILAKVTRDGVMRAIDQDYPGYGFARHKGYGTEEHKASLKRLVPCPAHRQSFRPVADLIRIQ